MLRKLINTTLILLLTHSLSAKSGEDVYQFLNIPTSVSAAGVGGNSVSSAEKDLNLIFHNPGILSSEMNNDFSVGFMRYVADINIGSAAYAHKINDRSSLMVGLRYVDYGDMLWTTPEDEVLGKTSAQDLALTGAYSWLLSQHWRAGGSINFIYSALDEYKSTAITVDLGLYYKNPENLYSAGLVLKNIGSQISSYHQTYERMPFDIQFGVSKKLEHAPFRFTLTAQNLSEFNLSYLKDQTSSSDRFANLVFKHLLFGVEFIPSENFLLSLGYNHRRSSELDINQRTPFGGFTSGFSMQVKKVRVGASFAKYHASGGTLQLTLGMNASNFGL